MLLLSQLTLCLSYVPCKTNKQSPMTLKMRQNETWLDALPALGQLSGHQPGPHLVPESQVLIKDGNVEAPRCSLV